MRFFWLSALLVPCVSAVATPPPGQRVYDYIVVGGGTAGLVVANRLSEDKKSTVLVVEAGDSVFDNPLVKDLIKFVIPSQMTDVDWQYPMVPQKFAGGTQPKMSAGKAVGGTSTINGMDYIRAEKGQIDAWEQLGNEGWNWNNLFPYYKKSEGLKPPGPAQKSEGATYNPAFHGTDGPLTVGWDSGMLNGSFQGDLRQTFANNGIPHNDDPNGGSLHGYNVFPRTLDSDLHIREDSARAYFWPVQGQRKNLHILTKTIANKIVWTVKKNGDATAKGVEVSNNGGNAVTVRANKEVILSAGTHRTPQLLELSGVGQKAILDKYKIPVKVDLPGVGEHVQDQPLNFAIFNSTGGTFDGEVAYVGYANGNDIFGADAFKALGKTVQSSLGKYAQRVVDSSGGALKAADIQSTFQSLHDLIFKQNIPILEITPTPFEGTLYMIFWGLLPFARGSVHLSGTDPTAFPVINPNYYMQEYDAEVQLAAAKYMRKLTSTSPLKKYVTAEAVPGLATVAATATDDVWLGFLKSTFMGNYHAISSAIMLPQDKGGVVDKNLKVYGTTNVRVVDASVFPTQVCGHLTSTLYALAERAADIIRGKA